MDDKTKGLLIAKGTEESPIIICDSGPGPAHTIQKPGKPCLLPECEDYTTHNGGYCCVEHCKLHMQLLKIKNRRI
jgi:hypothetical protein